MLRLVIICVSFIYTNDVYFLFSIYAGICQRHTDMFYNFIRDHKDEIIADVQAFYYHVIKDNFPDKSCKYM